MRQRQATARRHDASERKRLFAATGAIGFCMIAAAAGGFAAGSLALIAAAAHMLTTGVMLGLTLYGRSIAEGRAVPLAGSSFERVRALALYTTGVVALGVGAVLIVCAGQRVNQPVSVSGSTMLAASLLALANVATAAWLLFEPKAAARSGVFLHAAVDALLTGAIAIGAVTMLLGGWHLVDTLLAVLIAFLIVMSAFSMIQVSGIALLGTSSSGLNRDSIARDIESNVKGVLTVRDVRVWSPDGRRNRVTLHACLSDEVDPHAVICDIKLRLAKHHRIDHVTVEPEFDLSAGRPVGALLH